MEVPRRLVLWMPKGQTSNSDQEALFGEREWTIREGHRVKDQVRSLGHYK